MRRALVAVSAVVMLLAAAAATWAVTKAPPIGSTLGRVVDLGGTSVPVHAPTCPTGVSPANCAIVMERATALETVSNGNGFPTSVKQAGEIVAFKVGLAQLSPDAKTQASIISSLNSTYGGVTQAQLTVLKAGRNRAWTVVAQSPRINLQPYLGYVVQLPLAKPIPVTPGEALALTVPTWAPILSYDLPPKSYAYRQSRMFNCSKPGVDQNAQLTIGQTTRYLCSYPGTRAEYSAIELTNPNP